MFGFLKKKLGEVISKFSDKVKEEAKIEEQPKPKQEAVKPAVAVETKTETKKEEIKPPAQPAVKPAAEAKAEIKKEIPVAAETTKKKEEAKELPAAPKAKEKTEERIQPSPAKAESKEKTEEATEQVAVAEPRKKGFFEKITGAITGAVTTTKISDEKFEQMFWDLEVALLENNAAVEVIGKIKTDLKQTLVDKPLPRGKIEDTIRKTLRGSIEGLFPPGHDFMKGLAAGEKPYKVMFVGINGSGKTTTIAKMAKLIQDKKLKVVIAAADTFRAAAIHQLQEHADKLGVKLIKHDYGADPAAVAFDAIKYAEAHSMDVVLIDTAGRLHSNVNLVEEMKKIARVAKPNLKLFVGESITGNDCVEQARSFNKAIGIDGIILSKADIDEKGGAAISVSYITKKPILFLGTGQGYNDLTPFNADTVVEQLGL